MSNKWFGLQFKCTCGKVFQVGAEGFKPMKQRIMEHAEEEIKKGVAFEILPTNPERAIGMRWQCSRCKKIIRLNKAGLDDLRKRVMEHARIHAGEVFKVVPIG